MGISLSYEFPDVTTLDVVDLIPTLPGLGSFWSVASPDAGASTRLRMTLVPIPEGLERLTVHFPRFRLNPSTEPPSAWASGSVAEMAALERLMAGAHVTIAVATESPLVRTNSPFREGHRVTLVDVDVAAALFSKEVQRMVATPGTFDELLSWYSTVPGVTLAPEHDITLDFENPSTQRPATAGLSTATPSSSDTEIFLSAVIGAGAALAIGPPRNISNSPGYDNQPSFSPDGASIFFASARGAALPARASVPQQSSIPRTDIYRYEIPSGRLFRVTQTPESEFSPTVMPDGSHVSMIRVEADGTQRLSSIEPADIPKRETSVILPNVKPVGYHAWIDATRVALYVLGERGQPASLQIASTTDGSTRRVALNIGRSLRRTPTGSISFIQRETAPDGGVTAVLKELDAGSLEARTLVPLAAGITDPSVAWMPDGTAVMAAGATIYRWHAGDKDWTAVAHLDGFGLRNVTRLAVSPRGDRIAIVAEK
jgi:hypothetical protein